MSNKGIKIQKKQKLESNLLSGYKQIKQKKRFIKKCRAYFGESAKKNYMNIFKMK